MNSPPAIFVPQVPAKAIACVGVGAFGQALTAVLTRHQGWSHHQIDDLVANKGREPICDVVVAAFWRPSSATALLIDAWSFDSHTPWLPVVLHPCAIECGPMVRPGETACYRCSLGRQTSLSELEARHESVIAVYDDSVDVGPGGFTPVHLEFAHAMVQTALSSSSSDVLSLDLSGLRLYRSEVIPIDGCRRCRIHRNAP